MILSQCLVLLFFFIVLEIFAFQNNACFCLADWWCCSFVWVGAIPCWLFLILTTWQCLWQIRDQSLVKSDLWACNCQLCPSTDTTFNYLWFEDLTPILHERNGSPKGTASGSVLNSLSLVSQFPSRAHGCNFCTVAASQEDVSVVTGIVGDCVEVKQWSRVWRNPSVVKSLP